MAWFEVFDTRIPHIYFIYGLAFFTLGLAMALEIGRAQPARFSRAMRPLAVFGLAQGRHEWAVVDGDKNTGWGLMGLQERVRFANGEVQIQAGPGKGTRLIIKIPLNKTRGIDYAAHQADVG